MRKNDFFIFLKIKKSFFLCFRCLDALTVNFVTDSDQEASIALVRLTESKAPHRGRGVNFVKVIEVKGKAKIRSEVS